MGLKFRLFEYMEKYDYEEVVFCQEEVVGLKAIVAIHDTTLGPALGGLRIWKYRSEEDALMDALRLARAMTYKAAAAGLNLGGGKAVILADPRTEKTEEMLRAFGRFVESLGGRYITAEDVGTSVEDMDIIWEETRYVVGVSPARGGSGDPSPVTAYGVWWGIKACAKYIWGTESLKGKKVAVQGMGHVGQNLVRYMAEVDAEENRPDKIYVTDIYRDKVEPILKKYGELVEYVEPDKIYDADVDIFAPCALGGVINDDTIPRLKRAGVRVVAGGANNQLKDEERHGKALMEAGILYAPDYVINAGGLINVYTELEGYDRELALSKTRRIYNRLLEIFELADREKITTKEAADRIAEERIRKIGHVKKIYTGRF